MASLHKTWYRCDACGNESDDTEVVHNRFQISRAHRANVLKEVCDSCALTINNAITVAMETIRSRK